MAACPTKLWHILLTLRMQHFINHHTSGRGLAEEWDACVPSLKRPLDFGFEREIFFI